MISPTSPARGTFPARGTTAALLTAAAVFLLAGCDSAPAAAPAPRAEAPAADPQAAFLAEVAARCATATASPTPTAPAGEAVPPDPESRKYAENHAYRQQTRLTPAARCRGEAHAARIRAELATAPAANPAELTALLRGLGYPVAGGDVYEGNAAEGPGFALMVPGTGPCVSGRSGAPARVEVHGVYVEGGCREPAGGH
ncbi:hypothetical protein ACFY7H_12600 [Streptomyces sp. NPDC012794]|uniref:hypothetical protein n=1 Tax=Streptomyces sp. NPDC012794 TaxID=3364850 RepID=UPI0036982C98